MSKSIPMYFHMLVRIPKGILDKIRNVCVFCGKEDVSIKVLIGYPRNNWLFLYPLVDGG